MRYLTVASVRLVALVWAAGASAIIVPQHSIAGVALDMTRAQVKDKKGQPDRVIHGTNDFGVYTGRDHSTASAPAMIARGEVPVRKEPDVVELEV